MSGGHEPAAFFLFTRSFNTSETFPKRFANKRLLFLRQRMRKGRTDMNSRTKNTERTMTDITFLFFTGAVTGWCYEVLLHVFTAACGVIEYVTSWAMEVIYHTRWWDYSNFRLNLNGRIFAGGLLGFGLAGCLFAYGVLPVLTKLYRKIPEKAKRSIAFLFICVFFADAVVSLLFPNAGTGITRG